MSETHTLRVEVVAHGEGVLRGIDPLAVQRESEHAPVKPLAFGWVIRVLKSDLATHPLRLCLRNQMTALQTAGLPAHCTPAVGRLHHGTVIRGIRFWGGAMALIAGTSQCEGTTLGGLQARKDMQTG
jgi:hypothetical protein